MATDWEHLGLVMGAGTALVVLALLSGHIPALQGLYLQVSGSLLGLVGLKTGHHLLSNRPDDDGDDAISPPANDGEKPVVVDAAAPWDLEPIAAKTLEDFLQEFPDAVVTSGRRSIQEQAQAMAQNCRVNRDWIRQTYKGTAVSDACQRAVDGCQSPDQFEAALLEVLDGHGPVALRTLSWHLSGEAFDIHPRDDARGDAMRNKLESIARARVEAGGEAKFLSSEGGLVRWHLQVA